MASEPPPSGASVRAPRPRYLVVALVAALVLAAGCWTEGCDRLLYYRGAHDGSTPARVTNIRDDGARAEVETLYKRQIEITETARNRGVPIAAATFVLGAALLVLAARGLAGRSNSRSAIMQVVTVQAFVVIGQFFAIRDVIEAQLDAQLAYTLAHAREALRPEQYQTWAPIYRGMRRWGAPGWLVIRTIASGLIVVALTRQRSRDFFEAAADTAPER